MQLKTSTVVHKNQNFSKKLFPKLRRKARELGGEKVTVKDGEAGIFFVFCPKVYTRPYPNLQSLNLALKEQKSVHV